MDELIKIQVFDGKPCVNARNLWEFLKVGREFATWIKERIEKYEFIESIDYTRFDNFVKGEASGYGNRTYKDYYISINMAKELSMVENNEQGKEARNYFITCEEKLRSQNSELSELQESEIIAKGYQLVLQQNERLKDKLSRLIHSSKLYSSTEIAKELNFKSAYALNKFLESKKIQYKLNGTWVLYADYAEKGYTSIKQWEQDNGLIIYDCKWTGKGREFILDLFSKEQPNV